MAARLEEEEVDDHVEKSNLVVVASDDVVVVASDDVVVVGETSVLGKLVGFGLTESTPLDLLSSHTSSSLLLYISRLLARVS